MLNIKDYMDLIYAVLGVFGIGWIATWVHNAMRDKETLRNIQTEKETEAALENATKAIKNLSDSELDKYLHSKVDSSGDSTEH